MPAYQYRVARSDGTTVEGRAEGEDEKAVRAQLEGRGLLVFSLRRLGAWPAVLDARRWGRRTVPLREFLVFNQEFLALIKAGLSILRVWDLLIERTRRPAFQATLRAVRQDVRAGASMAEALSRHPHHFPDLYIASVRAGEQAGNLPDVLQRYIVYLKLIIGLRQKMMKALAYPAFLDERTLIYTVTADDGSGSGLYTIDVERRLPHRASFGAEEYISVSADSGGHRLVATAVELEQQHGRCIARIARGIHRILHGIDA